MSDLTNTLAHATEMAARTIDPRDTSRHLSHWCDPSAFYDPPHGQCVDATCRCACHPRHVPTEDERRLWRQIAEEIAAHLAGDDGQAELFGEAS